MNNDSLKNKSFMGFETWQNNIRMLAKMQIYIVFFLLILQVMISVLIFFGYFTADQLAVIFAYLKSLIALNPDGVTTITLGGIEYQPTLKNIKEVYASKVALYFKSYLHLCGFTFLIYLLYIPINIFFYRRNKSQTNSVFQKGAILVKPEKLKEMTKHENRYLPFGEATMPVSAETKHTLIVGRPGTGKTVCMSAVLEKMIARGDRVVIHDFKGDYLQKFYRPGVDIIFNPLDSRSHFWNFFDEINSPVDVDATGYALIPDAKGTGLDPFWNNAARDVFTGIVNNLIREKKTTYMDLYSVITAPADVISDILKITPGSEAGATTIADHESKQTGSILSVLAQFTKIFYYMKDIKENGKSLNIDNWLSNPNGGNIFITNYANLQDTIAPIITLMIDLMGRKLLSMPDDSKRRVFFMLDEFGALQKMQTIASLLTLARSKGGGVLIGIQDLGQIDKIYGKETKQTIVNACGSNVVFAVADSDTADTLSKKYGEYISIENYVTQSMGVQNNRDGISINQQKNKERIIMPSEITGLADLNCYVQFSGYPVTKTQLPYRVYPNKNEPFNMRTGLSYHEILAAQTAGKNNDISHSLYETEKQTEVQEEKKNEQILLVDKDRIITK